MTQLKRNLFCYFYRDMKNFKIVEKDMYQKMFSNPQGQTEEGETIYYTSNMLIYAAIL